MICFRHFFYQHIFNELNFDCRFGDENIFFSQFLIKRLHIEIFIIKDHYHVLMNVYFSNFENIVKALSFRNFIKLS